MAENVLDIVVALYSFSSTNEQELSFEKGDRLEILDRPPSDPEWYLLQIFLFRCFKTSLFRYKARNAQGQIGLVPRNYLQELSEYLTQPYQDRRQEPIERQPGVLTERPHLKGKPWYHGSITRNQCDSLLNQHGHDGDFLIRDSETNVRTIFHSLSVQN